MGSVGEKKDGGKSIENVVENIREQG